MQYQIERIERELSAGEIADFIGVSQMTQRNWRRHNYLPPSDPARKVRFRLLQTAYLGLMKAQIDLGIEPGKADAIATMTAPLAVMQISICPMTVAVTGMDLAPHEWRRFVHEQAGFKDGELPSRYLFLPSLSSLPKHSLLSDEDETPPSCYSFASLAEMEGEVSRNWISGQIFDLQAFAISLGAKAGPLITYIATPEDH